MKSFQTAINAINLQTHIPIAETKAAIYCLFNARNVPQNMKVVAAKTAMMSFIFLKKSKPGLEKELTKEEWSSINQGEGNPVYDVLVNQCANPSVNLLIQLLYIESEVHHISVLNKVLFPLNSEPAVFPASRF